MVIIVSVVVGAVLLVAAGVGFLCFSETSEEHEAPAAPSVPQESASENIGPVRPPLTEAERREIEQAIVDLEEVRARLEAREIKEMIDAGELPPCPSTGE